jgi:protein-L-isoaspartate(D-aspartate) O-methyltransferase
LFDQLAEDGRMVAVVGRGGAAQAYVFTKDSGKVSSRKLFNLSIPSIPGFERTAEFQF